MKIQRTNDIWEMDFPELKDRLFIILEQIEKADEWHFHHFDIIKEEVGKIRKSLEELELVMKYNDRSEKISHHDFICYGTHTEFNTATKDKNID